MQASQNKKELFAEARSLEQAGQWKAAAEGYQRLVDENPGNRDAVKRLLMVYRHLKDSPRELSAIEAALLAVEEKDQSAQGKWLAENPQAAKLGKAMLRSLGGLKVSAYVTDSFVEQLLKRKDLVERKLTGTKRIKASNAKRPADKKHRLKNKGKESAKRVPAQEKPKQTVAQKRREAVEKKREERVRAIEKRREEAAAKKAEAREKAVAAAERKKETATRKKEERAAAIEEKRKKAAEARAANRPSVFVINLRYRVPLEKIDAVMAKHVAFLDNYFKSGIFLVAGRQIPRTGGIIIASGINLMATEKIMKQDPFIKGNLASFEIVEFRASKSAKGLQRLLGAKINRNR